MTEGQLRGRVARTIAHGLFVVLILSLAAKLVSAQSTTGVVLGIGLVCLLLSIYIAKGVAVAQRVAQEASDAVERERRAAGDRMQMALVLALLMLGGVACSRVEPGHVGIVVHLYGSQKGVDFEPRPVGMYWLNPWTTDLYSFPTYVQTAVWTRDASEGSPSNEELTFNTKEGMVVSTDISLSYHLEAEQVPAFFAKFRTDNLAVFTHGFMRNVARDAFNDLGPAYSVEQVYGEAKETLRKQVVERIQQHVAPFGVVVEQFGYIGALRLPGPVIDSLNAKIQAGQIALQKQTELAQAQADAAKKVAAAKGDADALLMRANAEAQANTIIARSLTSELVQYETVRRWNGQRPQVEGAQSGLMLMLGSPQPAGGSLAATR